MKEIKVYIDELPTECLDCRFAYDGRCQAKGNGESCCIENCRRSDCPLIDIKTHDQELVKEVCEKIKLKFSNTRSHNWGIEQFELYEFLDQIQELEGEDE